MTCEELRRLVDEEGTVSTPEAQAHLAACPECMLLARRWAEVQGALHGMGQEPAPPFLHARIMAHVRSAEEVSARSRRSFLHGWRAPAVAALGAAVVIVGLGLYSAVRPLAVPSRNGLPSSAQTRQQLPAGEAGLEKKAAAPAPTAAPAESVKDELVRSEGAGSRQGAAHEGGRRERPHRRSRWGTHLAARVCPGFGARTDRSCPHGRDPGPPESAGTALREQVVAAPAPATGVLQVIAPSTQQTGLVKCRLRLEGDHQELDVELPQAEAPTPDQVWLVTLHPDGRIELRDTQGQDRQAPLALQQGLTQQQARTGRYRLSQAPLR